MKKNIARLSATILCAACVAPTFANDQKPDPAHDKRTAGREYRADTNDEREALGKVVKASDVIGRDIHNAHQEKIGSVADLAVDLKTGRIVYVLVDTKAGAVAKSIVVPPGSLQCPHDGKTAYAMDVSKQRLKDAPNYEAPERTLTISQDKVAEVYRYYGQTPYFLDETKRTPRYAPLVGPVLMASKIIGLPVQNRQDQKLGSVENLIVNLESGRVAHVIVSSGGFLGVGDDLSVVPPASFVCDSEGKPLVLDVNKETLSGAPRFSSKSWPDFSNPEYSTTVYRAYKVDPYFSPHADADNTALNVRDRNSKELTPLDQGSSDSDVEITRKIRRELVADDNFSVNARNVKIITKNGEITLRGPVNSMEEKRRIAEIVNRLAANAPVNNQLEVKTQTNN